MMKQLDLTKVDINDEIDKYLKKLYANKSFKMFATDLYEYLVMNNDGGVIDMTMLEEGLIRIEGDTRMLTSRGIDISKLGGWTVFLSKKSEYAMKERMTQEEIQNLTKKQLELSIREMQVNFTQIKNWWLILAFTIIASALLGAWLQSIFK